MNRDQILKTRVNRKTRLARPFDNFYESIQQCITGASALLKGEVAPQFSLLLERSIVITAVTAIEVYYRDMLDAIFRHCTEEFLEPKLKHLHSEKYDIIDILDIYRHRIHPVELITSNQSFQNAERIDKVFSNFTSGNFWKIVLNLHVSLDPDFKPENVHVLKDDDLKGLQNIFKLRHELVHDPARKAFFTYEVLQNLEKSQAMVWVSDLVLVQVIESNKRTDFKNQKEDKIETDAITPGTSK